MRYLGWRPIGSVLTVFPTLAYSFQLIVHFLNCRLTYQHDHSLPLRQVSDGLKGAWVDMHISRIFRENEKWFCEIFLARNAAARNCEKNPPFLANFGPNLTKYWVIFKVRFLFYELTLLYHWFLTVFWNLWWYVTDFDFEKKISIKIFLQNEWF